MLGPFALGRVHCCDCLEALRQLPDGCVDAIVTDPPYSSGGQFRGDRSQATAQKYVQTGDGDTCRVNFAGDNRDQRSFLVWCSLWMGEALRVCKPGAVLLVFTDWRQLPTVTDAVQCGGWVWRNLVTWWKPGVRMQRGRPSSSAEYLVYASSGVPTEGEKSPQNVLVHQPVSGEDKVHIAEKPLPLMMDLLGLSPAGSLVLDPFAGSGTTGRAAALTGRRFLGFDLDPHYAGDICAPRLEAAAKGLTLQEHREGQGALFGGDA